MQQFRGTLLEWIKDHRMFASTLEELGSQLAALQPPLASQPGAAGERKPRPAPSSGGQGQQPDALLQSVLQAAPSDALRAYVEAGGASARLQRTLPEQLDQNLRLLSLLAAEMRALLAQLEQAADGCAAGGAAAAGAGVAAGDDGNRSGGADGASDQALLLAALLDGVARETQLVETAAAGLTLTTPPEEAAAAATVIQLQPFLDATLLAAALEEVDEGEEQAAGAAGGTPG